MLRVCNNFLYIINGAVVLVTTSDTSIDPDAPETFFLQRAMASIGASIMPIGLPSLMDTPTMWRPSCAWNSRSGTAGLPFQRHHVGPASADRSEEPGGGTNKYCLDSRACCVELLYA